jgi:hypothetical protein
MHFSAARRLIVLIGMALAVTGSVGPAAGAAGTDAVEAAGIAARPAWKRPYVAPAGPVFGAPVGRKQVKDNVILRVLLRNIQHTPPGATIRIVARSFGVRPAADALIAAHRRGVEVKVLVDGDATRGSEAVTALRRELGARRHAASYLYRVKGSARGGDTEQHQKTWSFSRTGQSERVVMVGSTNLSYRSMGQFNNMYSFVGREDVWREFRQVFRDQVRDRPLAHPAVSVDLGRDHAWFYPGFSVDSDPMRRYLSRLPAKGLRVRVAMLAWHGSRGARIAQVLATKARQGARVQVIATTIGTDSRKILEAAGVEVIAGLKKGNEVHDKLMLVQWKAASGVRERRILTGSDNFGTAALGRDEVVMAIDAGEGDAWRAYGQHYRMLVERVSGKTVR